ncbi:MAG: ribosome biogenesis GTP-binding protein YihA/YsxC [Elusimicrobia bacterium]|nr:ribosome biogenesis GTP-binding protein YihA/YsxC [Elusimicrobiota bacterium]
MSKYSFNEAQYVMSVDSPQKLGASQAEVAFVGRSNVGKSSLLNALCGQRKLAKVSKTPGKTRTINIFAVRYGKWIVDLPGYGFAAVAVKEKEDWQHMIEYYLTGRPTLKCVFVLVDASVGITKLDREMLLWLQSSGMPYRVVANKIDRIAQPKLVAQRQALAQDLETVTEHIVWASAKKNTGIAELHAIVSDLLAL